MSADDQVLEENWRKLSEELAEIRPRFKTTFLTIEKQLNCEPGGNKNRNKKEAQETCEDILIIQEQGS